AEVPGAGVELDGAVGVEAADELGHVPRQDGVHRLARLAEAAGGEAQGRAVGARHPGGRIADLRRLARPVRRDARPGEDSAGDRLLEPTEGGRGELALPAQLEHRTAAGAEGELGVPLAP